MLLFTFFLCFLLLLYLRFGGKLVILRSEGGFCFPGCSPDV